MRLQKTRDEIVRLLVQRAGKEGLRLKDIVDALGMSNAAVLSHLGILQRDGLVEAKHEGPWGRGTRYWARPAFQALWLDPAARSVMQWSAGTPFDWRFPLVSRVRDGPAQDYLYRWLDLLQAQGKLPPMASKNFRQGKAPPLLQIVVYGSCARGDATSRSDIDILVYTDLDKRTAVQIKDLAHDPALRSGRSPDLRVVTPKEWAKATPDIRANVQREGLTVFSNDPTVPFLEQAGAAA